MLMPEQNEILTTTPELSPENKSVQTRDIIDHHQPEAFVPRELKSFLQKIEDDPTTTPTFDPSGQPQLSPSPSQNPKIVIPITRTTFIDGFKKSFDDVGHWLSVFFFREIKLKESHITFKPDDT